jgi:hypothetical protein
LERFGDDRNWDGLGKVDLWVVSGHPIEHEPRWALGLLGIDRAVAVGVHAGDEARRIESPATESTTETTAAETTAAETTAAETSTAAVPTAIPTAIPAAIGSSTHDHHRRSTATEGHSWGLGQGDTIQR